MSETELVAKTYKGIYGMHKYWSKKPFNLIHELIIKNSKEGEIVLDPFCGSGISVIEAILSNRKAVGVDLNPAAIFITKQTLMKIDPELIQKTYQNIQSKIAIPINELYKVERENQNFTGTHFVWEKDKLVEVWYKDNNNKKIVELATKNDIEFTNSFSYDNVNFFYPTENLIANSRINAKNTMRVYDLFTPRNLLALSMIFNQIESIKEENLKDLFKYCFTASIGQASRMVFVINTRGKMNGKRHRIPTKEIGSWVIGYWVPKQNFEINVWNCFTNRYNRILKAKKDQFNFDYELNFCENFSELQNKNLLLKNESALDFLKTIDSNTIDYVLTDPPHGNRIPFLELSLMWNSWLRKTANFEKELVVSDAKGRGKNIENYKELFSKIIKEITRVLKTKRTFTLVFNSLDDETWKDIIDAINETELKLEKIGTMGYSAASVVQDNRTRGLKTDFVLNFVKSTNKQSIKIKKISAEKEKEMIHDLVQKMIQKNESVRVYKIMNDVVGTLLEKGISFNLSTILLEIDIATKQESSILNT